MVMVINAAFNGLGQPLPGVAVSIIRMVLVYLPAEYSTGSGSETSSVITVAFDGPKGVL